VSRPQGLAANRHRRPFGSVNTRRRPERLRPRPPDSRRELAIQVREDGRSRTRSILSDPRVPVDLDDHARPMARRINVGHQT